MALATHQRIYRALKEIPTPQQKGWSVDSDDVAVGLSDELFLRTGQLKVGSILPLKGGINTLYRGQTADFGWRLYSRENKLGRAGIGRLVLDSKPGEPRERFAYIVAEEELESDQRPLTVARLATEGIYRALNGHDEEQSDFLLRLADAYGEEYSKGIDALKAYKPSQMPSVA